MSLYTVLFVYESLCVCTQIVFIFVFVSCTRSRLQQITLQLCTVIFVHKFSLYFYTNLYLYLYFDPYFVVAQEAGCSRWITLPPAPSNGNTSQFFAQNIKTF